MHGHRSYWRSTSLGPRVGLVALTAVILMIGLSRVECPLGAVLRIVLSALPSILLAAWHTLQAPPCDHARILDGVLHLAGSSWPVIFSLAAAV